MSAYGIGLICTFGIALLLLVFMYLGAEEEQ